MKKIFKKRNLICWAICGLLLSWLFGCNLFSTPTPTKTTSPTVEFWTMQLKPQFTDYFDRLIVQFQGNNPNLQIGWVDVPWADMEKKILTAVSAKTAPDVVNLNPNFASQLAGRNAWLDLNSKLDTKVKEQYLPKIWQASTIGNLSFGIPWYLTTRVSIYNQDLLTKASIVKPPTTYSELAVAAKQIKDKTGKYAFFVTFVPEDSGEVLESFVQMGVKLVDENGRAAFNSPEGLEAFRYWVDLYKQSLLPKEVLTQGHRHAIELYQSGETALLSSGAEFLKNIETNAPTIAKVSVPAPQITGKTGKTNVAVMNLVIPRDTEKPDDALKFALFVTNTENQLAFAKAANVLPSTVDAVKQYIQDLENMKNTTPVEQARKISATQLENAEVLIPAMKNLNKLQKIIYENLQAAMLNEKSVEQAVTDAAKEWDSLGS
jgi:putative chitobiose transport system substrate-binding protein